MCASKIAGTFLAALLVVGLGISQASAEDREDRRQREAVERARVQPNDAAEIARKEFPNGRVLDVDVETIRGTVTYAVEVETDRRIRTVLVDLESGNVLSVRSNREDDDDDDEDDDDDDD
jgi:uncharacterized membrane protein YkoI